MNLVKPFVPSIGVSSLSAELTAQLLEVCVESSDDLSRRVNSTLVGLIEKETNIQDKIKDTVLPVIQREVTAYLSNAESIYKNVGPFNKLDLTCVSSWCNIQEAGEHNPIHSHPADDIVCVIFPKVDIDTSYKKYTTSDNILPGSLVFHCHGDSRFGTNALVVTPKTGDMYIFPASLYHFTAPFFKEGDSRISVSCNFAFTDLFYSSRRLRGYQ